jgi:hypothetical protein
MTEPCGEVAWQSVPAAVKDPISEQRSARTARIIVETEVTADRPPEVVMDEHLVPIHLATEPGASQFVERVVWALHDAEEAERTPAL